MILTPHTFRRLCLARDRLREVTEDHASIADIAREAGISPFHFIRQFEAVFGMTPHQFRIHARLDRARHLLAAGQHSVTDVCLEVGFRSLGSFSDLFRRRVGAAPSFYQRRVRAMVAVPGGRALPLTPGCLTLMWHLPASASSQFSRSAPQVVLSDSMASNSRSTALDAHQTDEPHGR